MKTTDIIRRAGRNLRQAKLRTFLTALAISVGAFTITLALAAGTGTQNYVHSLIAANGDSGRIIVIPKASDAETRQSKGQQTPPALYTPGKTHITPQFLTDTDAARIEKLPHVVSVTPDYNVTPTYMQRSVSSPKYSLTATVKADRSNVTLAAGKVDADNQLDAGTIMIPASYVSALGFSSAQAAIGETIILHFDEPTNPLAAGKDMTYRIAAVNKPTAGALNVRTDVTMSPQDGKAIYQYQNPGAVGAEYSDLNVEVDNATNATAVKNSIIGLGSYSALSFQDMSSTLFQFINVVQYGVAGFGMLAILASIFGIINTQYISVLERTQQIGLMKALGARRRDIGRLFRYEAAWVGFLGGIIGTCFALLVGLLNPTITKALNLEKGTNLLMFKPLYSVILILALMLVAVLAGYFPSRKAAKLDPIEALRTE